MACELVHEAAQRLFNTAGNRYLRFKTEIEWVFAFGFLVPDREMSTQMSLDKINVPASTLYF
jgi:hypothetical protein